MQHSIENDFLKISILQKGIELCSLQSKKTGLEYMWEAKDIWSSHAPILFPVIGQTREQGYVYNGKQFKIPRHGFIRDNENFKITKEDNCIICSLDYDSSTLAVYPFQFRFTVYFRLIENQLKIEHKVENLGASKMLFSLGGHPAFRCPRHTDEQYSDYYLEFEQEENSGTWKVGYDGLIENETEPFFQNTRILELNKELFENDALVFKDLKSRKISLRSKKSSERLTVSYKDFNYMGIWAKYGGDFICIEPWLGIADSIDANDDFSQKEGIISLEAKSSFSANYSITITE